MLRRLPYLGRHGRANRWRRSRGALRVWAHRGASADATENTVAAFELARAQGADGVELDVRLDASGEVVVFHDEDLERLARRPGRVEELSADERRAVRLVGGHALPTLAEAIEAVGPLELNVELKSASPGRAGALARATAAVLRRSGAIDRVVVSSFDPLALLQCYRHLPELSLAYLFHSRQPAPLRRGWLSYAVGASLVHPDFPLCDEDSVRRWHAAGYAINVWTVDDPAELRRLDRLGVDGVFANAPGAARAALATPEPAP
ncbi:MAG: glycerophosphodiester phosphodiesterase [Kofleriaceae bacterium]